MGLRKIIKIFENGNVSVCGLRSRGKDMLMANVVVRRGIKYVSNIDYGSDFVPFAYEYIAQENTYDNFIKGDIKPYEYPFPDGTDIYLSDAGVYFPSQYCNELNKKYPNLPVFMALSRHLGACNVHYNAQVLNRVWDKIREQSDQYIQCRRCIVIGKLVIQTVRIYEKMQSALDSIPPFRVKAPLMASREVKTSIELQKQMYYCTHGKITSMLLIYFNKSSYDTRHFKNLLKGVKPNENKENTD